MSIVETLNETRKRIERAIQEKNLKIEVKKRLPQPKGSLPVGAPVSDLAWEQHEELHRLPTEVGSKNPKTFKLITVLCQDSEPE